MPPAGWEHGELGAEITALLRNFVKKHRLGRVSAADTGFRLSDGTWADNPRLKIGCYPVRVEGDEIQVLTKTRA